MSGGRELNARVSLLGPLSMTDGILKMELLIQWPNGATLSGTLLNIVSVVPFVSNVLPPACVDAKPSVSLEAYRASYDSAGSSQVGSGAANHVVDL